MTAPLDSRLAAIARLKDEDLRSWLRGVSPVNIAALLHRLGPGSVFGSRLRETLPDATVTRITATADRWASQPPGDLHRALSGLVSETEALGARGAIGWPPPWEPEMWVTVTAPLAWRVRVGGASADVDGPGLAVIRDAADAAFRSLLPPDPGDALDLLRAEVRALGGRTDDGLREAFGQTRFQDVVCALALAGPGDLTDRVRRVCGERRWRILESEAGEVARRYGPSEVAGAAGAFVTRSRGDAAGAMGMAAGAGLAGREVMVHIGHAGVPLAGADLRRLWCQASAALSAPDGQPDEYLRLWADDLVGFDPAAMRTVLRLRGDGGMETLAAALSVFPADSPLVGRVLGCLHPGHIARIIEDSARRRMPGHPLESRLEALENLLRFTLDRVVDGTVKPPATVSTSFNVAAAVRRVFGGG